MTFLHWLCLALLEHHAYGNRWYCPRCDPTADSGRPSFVVLPPKSPFKVRFKCHDCGFFGDARDILAHLHPDLDGPAFEQLLHDYEAAWEREREDQAAVTTTPDDHASSGSDIVAARDGDDAHAHARDTHGGARDARDDAHAGGGLRQPHCGVAHSVDAPALIRDIKALASTTDPVDTPTLPRRATEPPLYHPQGMGRGAWQSGTDYRRLYECLGVTFTDQSGDEVLAEECPRCGEENHFSVNVTTGLYQCFHCQAAGNITTFLTATHKDMVAATTVAQYVALGRARGIPPITLRRHGLAFSNAFGPYLMPCWLVPFRSTRGNVVNIQMCYPNRGKYMLPGLPTAIYGFDRLVAADVETPVLLCEGPFDAIALDSVMGPDSRARYVIVAMPGAFKAEWARHFTDRQVWTLFDNDHGGRQHTARVHRLLGDVARSVLALEWPGNTPDGFDVNDVVRGHRGGGVLDWLLGRLR
jgi:hypothetical protein